VGEPEKSGRKVFIVFRVREGTWKSESREEKVRGVRESRGADGGTSARRGGGLERSHGGLARRHGLKGRGGSRRSGRGGIGVSERNPGTGNLEMRRKKRTLRRRGCRWVRGTRPREVRSRSVEFGDNRNGSGKKEGGGRTASKSNESREKHFLRSAEGNGLDEQ